MNITSADSDAVMVVRLDKKCGELSFTSITSITTVSKLVTSSLNAASIVKLNWVSVS